MYGTMVAFKKKDVKGTSVHTETLSEVLFFSVTIISGIIIIWIRLLSFQLHTKKSWIYTQGIFPKQAQG